MTRRSMRSWGWAVVAVLAAVALALGLTACGGGDNGGGADTGGGGGGQISLRLGYVTPPEHPYGQALDYFVKEVDKASKGAIKVETLPNYPGGDVPLLQDVRGGTVEMASVSSAVWDTQGVKSFEPLQALGLITRYDLEQQVITGPIAQEMLKGTDAVGLKGLAIHEGGLRKPLGAKKILASPADFRGQTIRTPESTVLETGIRALGADPTSIPVTDVYAALRDGTVDGIESNLGLIQTNKFYEVAKFITANVNLWPFPTVLVINQRSFDGLSPDQQKIITDAAAKVPAFSIGILTAPSQLPKTLCDEGIKFAIASDADLAQFASVSTQVIAQLSRDPGVKKTIDQIQALKNSLGPPPAPAPLPSGCSVQAPR